MFGAVCFVKKSFLFHLGNIILSYYQINWEVNIEVNKKNSKQCEKNSHEAVYEWDATGKEWREREF